MLKPTPMRPPWEISPGSLPSAVRWQEGEAASVLDDFTAWLFAQDPDARHTYLDAHEAPALWRRWLDGRLTGKWTNPPMIFFRYDAPMRRLLPSSVPQPDRLEQLLDALDVQKPLPDTFAPAITSAWQTGDSPWGMVALLVWLERAEVSDAITRMRKVELGELPPFTVGAWLRDRVREPSLGEVTARLAVLQRNGKD